MSQRVFTCVFLGLAAWCTTALPFPMFESAWQAKYPDSTLLDRMDDLTDSSCSVCHSPAGIEEPGNCYREDLATLIGQGFTVATAIEQLDAEDSDGDGFTNGEEAAAPRPGEPGEFGYNMGVVGDVGIDPCGIDPGEQVTGVPETPPAQEVATASGWRAAWMALVMLSAGGGVILQRRSAV